MAGQQLARRPHLNPVIFENARIMFRNFAGEEKQYNEKGRRNFVLFLEEDVAQAMLADGWNVKRLKPREEEDGPGQPFLTVKVSFGKRPPKVVLVSSRGKTTLTEDTVSICDWIDIANVDLVLNPSFWDVNGKQGIAAYLKSIFITVVEDELDLKYADIQEIGLGAGNDEVLQLTTGHGQYDEIVIDDDEEDGPPWTR